MNQRAKLTAFLAFLTVVSHETVAQTKIQVFTKLLYYDGLSAAQPRTVPPSVLNLRNDLYAAKLTQAQLDQIQDSLNLLVTIGAACDIYDRIGNVNLVLVNKGDTSYKPGKGIDVTGNNGPLTGEAKVPKWIEVARFITPFTDKAVKPDTVPFSYPISNIARILKDTALSSKYDFWIELQVFGLLLPQAPCPGRTDVFQGSLQLITQGGAASSNNDLLMPLASHAIFNNFMAEGTDTLGKTTKTIPFSLTAKVDNAMLYLIASNHGSNTGGEEYIRRKHNVYVDNKLVFSYTPGGKSCEPYRVYNTRTNGIYQASPQPDSYWLGFNNWCPGDVIPIRAIAVGSLAAGNHTFQITVPGAVFQDKQGNFPFSVYLQAKASNASALMEFRRDPHAPIGGHPETESIERVTVYDLAGKIIFTGNRLPGDAWTRKPGIYWVRTLHKNKTEATIMQVLVSTRN